MYALIEYDGQIDNPESEAPTLHQVFSVKMMADIAVNLQSASGRKLAWYRFASADALKFNTLINNVSYSGLSFIVDINDTTHVVDVRLPDGMTTVDPYARKLRESDIDRSVRQAAFRSGTTSFFKNL